MRPELPDPCYDVTDTGDHPEPHHFLARHENPEYVAPAERRQTEENDRVGDDLGGIDEIETAGESTEQADHRMRCEVQGQREG